MGLTRITVVLKSVGNRAKSYEADFLIDTGATDSMAPGARLRSSASYQLANVIMNWLMEQPRVLSLAWQRLAL